MKIARTPANTISEASRAKSWGDTNISQAVAATFKIATRTTTD